MQNCAINIIGEEKCVACFACSSVCNKNALDFIYNKEGFLKAEVNNNCVDCGLCNKYCPQIQKKTTNKPSDLKVLGGWSLDHEIRLNSSSGGVFSEIAIEFIKNEGFVCGVQWKNNRSEHFITRNIDDLKLMRGSKYIQSCNLDLIYDEIIQLVKQGNKVLFSGVPCQIAAIKNIVKSSNLFTVEVACLGFPSYNILHKHCNETYNLKSIDYLQFRNKEKGWKEFSLLYQNKIRISHKKDLFYNLFMSKYIISEACSFCNYNEIPRSADITLADFWGVPKDYADIKGVSLIVTNHHLVIETINNITSKSKFFNFKLKY